MHDQNPTNDTQFCLSKDVADKKNNYCCFITSTFNGKANGGYSELPKDESISALKQKLNEEYKIKRTKIENIQQMKKKILLKKIFQIKYFI